MRRTAARHRIAALLGLALGFAPGETRAERVYARNLEQEHTSPGGAVTARYSFAEDRAKIDLVRGARRFSTIELGTSSECPSPYDFFIFDDGTLVTTGADCVTTAGEGAALTAYRPDGSVRWTRTARELLPSLQYMHFNIDSPNQWFTKVQLEGDPRQATGRIRITLISYDEIAVAVEDGAVERREVPIAALGDDVRALKARAYILYAKGEVEQSEALLRRVFELKPNDLEAGEALARRLTNEKRFAEAAAIWRRLDAQERTPQFPTYIGNVDIARSELAAALIRAESYPEALEVVTAALEQQPASTRYELLLGEIHLRLGDVDRSRSIFDEVIRRKEREIEAGELLKDDFDSGADGLRELAERIAEIARAAGHEELSPHYREEGVRRTRALWKKAPPPEDTGDAYTRAMDLLEIGAVDEAIAAYQPIARTAGSEIPSVLGGIYLNGGLVPRDFAAALHWYTIAAGSGSSRVDPDTAEVYLALCYLHRHAGNKPDDAAAAAWCRRAADAGEGAGAFWLAIHYASGRGVKRDAAQAEKLLRAAHERNYPRYLSPQKPPHESFSVAIRYGADTYFESLAMVPEFQWAANALEPLAARGVAVAEAMLGILYEGEWLGPLRDKAKALAYYERAARKGDAASMLELAQLSARNRNEPCEPASYAWLEKAAAAGEIWGYHYIAQCHIHGRVAQPDLKKAESALREFTTQWLRQHPTDDSPFRVGRRSRLPSERLYVELEKALGHEVERPVPVQSAAP